MAQLTVYLDDNTLKKIGLAAKREHKSVSRWVKKRLVAVFEHSWPERYFDIFGSLANEKLERPGPLDFSNDVKRTNL